ncbi:MAG: hypothetical protein GDA36_07160 [Rhodobacteraceae bacterium]|nr:hypothetical protein [Paracoccaceae bacterium]
MLVHDSYILSQDVTAWLVAEGVVDKLATSKTALATVRGTFKTWMDRSLTEISRVLVMRGGTARDGMSGWYLAN